MLSLGGPASNQKNNIVTSEWGCQHTDGYCIPTHKIFKLCSCKKKISRSSLDPKNFLSEK